jgi:hypothetical protein
MSVVADAAPSPAAHRLSRTGVAARLAVEIVEDTSSSEGTGQYQTVETTGPSASASAVEERFGT